MYEYLDNETVKEEQPVQKEAPQTPVSTPTERKASRNKDSVWKKIGIMAACGAVFGLLAGVVFFGINKVANYVFADKKVPKTLETPADKPDAEPDKREKEEKYIPNTAIIDGNGATTVKYEGISDVSKVAKSAMPAIVSITNKSVQEVRSMFGMGIREQERESCGSGIIIYKDDENLTIVTNNHVIEGADTITVGFIDDEVYEAKVKGKEQDCDLAVITVALSDLKEETLSKISVATVGDSSKLEVGQQVVAIGNALGYGQSVTTGIISALDREVTIDNITNTLIQTDAAINPGNSGGALLNMNCELIGINSAKFASAAVEGMGYAIPITNVKEIIEELINREVRNPVEDEREAGFLGITGLSVDRQVSEMYGIPEGVYLSEITEGSPAEAAGLIKGDVVKKFDGVTVKTIAELKEQISCYKAGETVDVIIQRQSDGEYKEKTVSVTLGSRKGTALDPDKKNSKDDGDDDASDEADDDQGVEDGEQNDDSYYYEYNFPGDGFNPFEDFFNFGY